MDWMMLLKSFAVGGLICVVGQLLVDYTKMTPARILVLFVSLGVVLTGIGVYEPLVNFAGAGATVPLTGFGYTLAKGVQEGVRGKRAARRADRRRHRCGGRHRRRDFSGLSGGLGGPVRRQILIPGNVVGRRKRRKPLSRFPPFPFTAVKTLKKFSLSRAVRVCYTMVVKLSSLAGVRLFLTGIPNSGAAARLFSVSTKEALL